MDDPVKTGYKKFDQAQQQAAATSETVLQDSQARYASAMENVRDLNLRLVEMANVNTRAALEATTQMISAKTPADLAEAWSTHATKQFSVFADQSRELAAVWQKMLTPPR